MKVLKRIMLIDDDHFTNFYNQHILERAKICESIIVFQNAKEALEYLNTTEESVDLILLDVNMPVMNGWQFLEEFEKLSTNKKTAMIAIMLTSSINSDDEEKANTFAAVKEFISKPLTPEKVTEIMALFGQSTKDVDSPK